MVKKLFKHELASYMRTWLPIQIIMLAVALLGRFVQFFEADTTAYSIIFGSSVTVYVLSIIVSFVLTSIVCIVRFYKNLFSGEGYLSFTLPVTTAQHILVKLSAALTVEIATVVVAIASVGVITAGEVFTEVVKAAVYIIKEAVDALGVHFILYAVEVILILILSTCSGLLLIYGCIALGQTFNKSRVGWAVGIYFIYYFICQILGTIFTTFITIFFAEYPMDNIISWIDAHPFGTVHIFLCFMIALYLITSTIYYAVTHFIVKRKLNLE